MSSLPTDHLRLPSIDGLRAFETAARLGSYERAAEALHITASAVGKRVSTLEDLLGTALFTRAGKGLALTAAGKEYREQVGAALSLLAAVPLHQRSVQRSERLRLRVPPTFARQVLVPHLEAYTLAHPHVELEVVVSIPYFDTAPSDADVEVRHAAVGLHGGRALMRETVTPVAAPSLLARLPPLRAPADLRHAPLLRSPLEPWAPWLQAAGLDWPEPSQGPKLLDLGLLLEASVRGQGVALARPSLARDWLVSGALVPLFDIVAEPLNQYCLLPHSGSDAATGFADWLVRLCAEVAAGAAEVSAASGGSFRDAAGPTA